MEGQGHYSGVLTMQNSHNKHQHMVVGFWLAIKEKERPDFSNFYLVDHTITRSPDH